MTCPVSAEKSISLKLIQKVQGMWAGLAGSVHTARKDPEIGPNIDFPIHRTSRNDVVIGPLIHYALAGGCEWDNGKEKSSGTE
jgi:hypothetical protein